MARWARDDDRFPDELYPGRPGWKEGCLQWLEEHPGRRLPFGEHGDATDVHRMAVEEASGWYEHVEGENSADPA